MTSEEKAKLDQLKFEMQNSTQQQLYPGDIYPFNALDGHANGAYADSNDINTNLDPNYKKLQLEQLQQQAEPEEDPERFNRIRKLIGQ